MKVVLVALSAVLGMLISTTGKTTGAENVDLLRVAEAYRLAEAVRDSVWPGGWGNTPFPLLLVTPERELLMAFPRTPTGFTEVGYSSLLRCRILERPRQFPTNLLASFPAFGLPSVIVIGQPETTGKTSTTWVLTVLHEHFHQFQTEAPDYFSAVEQLDLSGGDQTGMWMLNFPFPYQSPPVVEQFATLSRDLGRLLERSTESTRRDFWRDYARFLSGLSEPDRRYLSFQIWQEGVARYVELRAAEVASRIYDPTPDFKALPDFETFAGVADQMRAAIRDELANPDLAERQRVSFYAFGAGLALLLDKDAPDWKSRYLSDKFYVELYIEPAG